MDIVVGRTEAESLQRKAYAVFSREDLSGGRGIEVFLTGNAWGDFDGPAGRYDVTVHYLDESDGDGAYGLLLNDVVVHTWIGDGGGNGFGTPESETFTLDLATDDVIGIRSTKIEGEFGRIDYIEVLPASGSGGGSEPGETITASLGLGLNEAEFLTVLGGYATESNAAAGNGLVVATTATGSVAGNFVGSAGNYLVTVNYLDESDGVGSYSLRVNGNTVGSWQGTGGSSAFGSAAAETFNVSLAPGDVVEVRGTSGDGELARLDSLLVAADTGSGSGESGSGGSGSGTGGSGGTGDAAQFVVGRTQAEALDLFGGYEVQNQQVAQGGQVIGTLTSGGGSGVFAGPTGNYDLKINYLDESDGVATFRVRIDGTLVDTWQGTGGSSASGTPASRTVNVNLVNGATISLEGVRSEGEAARFDSVDISEGSGGVSTGAPIAVGRTEAEDLDLAGDFAVEALGGASGGEVVRAPDGTYTASGSFTGNAGTYEIDVDWFNENDGVSTLELLVNGEVRGSWSGTGGNGAFTLETETVTTALDPGDTIAVRGTRGGDEHARLDSLFLRVVESGPANTAPVVATLVPDASATAGSAFSLALQADTFFDADGDALILSAALAAGGSLPDWLNFNPSTGLFSGVPGASDAGVVPVEVTASDGELTASDTFNIEVTADAGPGAGSEGSIGLGVTEAEDLDLDNYEIENRGDASGGQSIRTFGTGTASGDFTGASGTYELAIDYFNESDGVASWTVLVNGVVNGAFLGTGGSSGLGTIATETFTLALETGDTITIRGENDAGALARLDKLTVTGAATSNIAPVLVKPIADAMTVAGSTFVFTVPANSFTDADGDILALSASLGNGAPLPAWLNFNPATATFSGTPGSSNVGALAVRVTASDGEASASDTFTLSVAAAPSGSAVVVAGSNEAEDLDLSGYEVENRGDASGGQAIRTFGTGTAAGTFSGDSGLYEVRVDFLDESDGVSDWSVLVNGIQQASFSGTGGTSGVGTPDVETFELVLQDGDTVAITGTRGGDELARLDRITLTSLETNEFPDASDDTAAGPEDTTILLDVLANDTDEEGDPLAVIAVQGQPVSPGGTVSVNGGTVTLNADGTLGVTPPADFVGDFAFAYTVSDGAGFDTGTATVSVSNTNDAPRLVMALAPVSLEEDSPLNVPLGGAFADVDPGDTVTLSATLSNGDPLPDWLALDATPGAEALFGTSTGNNTGEFSVTVTATDGAGETASATLVINVVAVNDAPVAVDDALTGREDTAIVLDLTSNDRDEDGDTLVVTAINGDSVIAGETVRIVSEVVVDGTAVTATCDLTLEADGTVTLLPPQDFVGPISFSYTVTDGEFVDTATATVTVTGTNDAPVVSLAIADQSAAEDTPFSFTLPGGTFTDPDGDVLALSAFQVSGQPLPDWLSFENGTFTGTPTASDAADLQLMVLASDGQFLAGSIFGLQVSALEAAPAASDAVTMASGISGADGLSFEGISGRAVPPAPADPGDSAGALPEVEGPAVELPLLGELMQEFVLDEDLHLH